MAHFSEKDKNDKNTIINNLLILCTTPSSEIDNEFKDNTIQDAKNILETGNISGEKEKEGKIEFEIMDED